MTEKDKDDSGQSTPRKNEGENSDLANPKSGASSGVSKTSSTTGDEGPVAESADHRGVPISEAPKTKDSEVLDKE